MHVYLKLQALIAERVSYVVAPYEADAQLAYLEKKAIIDGIITEDSDLLVFGCRKVLFKLDSDGQCVEVKRDNFTACKEFSFSGWTDKEFRQ
jgi:exonuclease-1